MKKGILYLLFSIFILFGGNLVFGQETEKSTKSDPNVPIFEIKNDLGQTVFAVYPGGVHIFVDDTQLKTTGGGFKVGRIGTEKATLGDIFTVVPGEVNVYIDNPLKVTGGGFKVGRVGTEKAAGSAANFLSVTPDSTKVNIGETGTGGFSVGKLGEIAGVDNFLNLTPENYFIGHNVAPRISSGTKNSVLGYYAGYSLVTGYNNIFIGDSAGYSNSSGHDNLFIGNRAGWKTTGNENIFIGNEAGYNSLSPVRNVFIGYQAGRKNQSGQYNVYMGDRAGTEGTGYYNTILGGQAASTNDFGNSNVAIGYVAGRDMVSAHNVYIGQGAGYNNSGTEGGNVFIGYYAGETLSSQDNRLAISNRNPTAPLIYGEFDNRRVVINGTNANGYNFFVSGTSAGTSAFAVFSDLRLKTNIITIPSALEKVLQLRGVSFDWKDPKAFDANKHIGFVAQEVEKIIPEVVSNINNNYSMQYAPITALLVEAMKEQQQEIERLKLKVKDIDGIKNENEQLRTKLAEFDKLKEEIDKLKKITKDLLIQSKTATDTN